MVGNKWVKILTLIFANGVNYLIGFLMAPFLSRALSYEDNGTYNQVIILVNLFSMLAQFGVINIITVFFADKRFSHRATFHTSLGLLFGSSILVTMIFCSGVFYLHALLGNPQLQQYILVVSPALFFQSLGSCATVILVYFNKIKVISIYTIVSNVVRVLGIFLCVSLLNSIDALIWWYSLFTVVQSLWLFLYLPRELFGGPVEKDPHLQKEIIQKSWPLLLTSLLGMGIFYIDGFLISGMLSIKEYAIYRNGAIEIPFIASIYNSISLIMLPNFARLYGDNKVSELISEKSDTSKLIAAIIFPIIIVVVLFSDKLIPLYLSDKYRDSVMIFAIYNLTTLIRINDYQDLLTIKGKSKAILYVNIIAFFFNIIVNIILISQYGIIGAAIAYTSTVYFVAIVLSILNAKEYEIALNEYIDYRTMFKMIAICIVMSLLIKYFFVADTPLSLIVLLGFNLALLYVVFYALKYLPLDKVLIILNKVKK